MSNCLNPLNSRQVIFWWVNHTPEPKNGVSPISISIYGLVSHLFGIRTTRKKKSGSKILFLATAKKMGWAGGDSDGDNILWNFDFFLKNGPLPEWAVGTIIFYAILSGDAPCGLQGSLTVGRGLNIKIAILDSLHKSKLMLLRILAI